MNNHTKTIFTALLLPSLMIFFFVPVAAAANVERGQKIYRFKCAKCHGSAGKGDGPMAKLLKPPPANFSAAGFFDSRPDAALKKSILKAKAPMPSFQAELDSGRLKESDIDAIIDYIKTFAEPSK